MSERISFSSAASSFLKDTAVEAAKSTLSNYDYNLRCFSAFLARQAVDCLGDITPDRVRDYFLERKAGYSQHTVHQSGRVLRTFFGWCVRQDLLTVNPVDKVKFPKWPDAESKSLTVEQVKRLFLYARGTLQPERDMALFYVLLDCGLRRGEVAHLSESDLDLENRTITVQWAKWGRGRSVPLSGLAVSLLAAWVQVRPVDKRLFCLNPQGVRMVCARAAAHLGFRLYPHLCRHTFASLYDGDLLDLSRILGHRDVSTTARVYTHRSISGLVDKHNDRGISRFFVR